MIATEAAGHLAPLCLTLRTWLVHSDDTPAKSTSSLSPEEEEPMQRIALVVMIAALLTASVLVGCASRRAGCTDGSCGAAPTYSYDNYAPPSVPSGVTPSYQTPYAAPQSVGSPAGSGTVGGSGGR